MELGTKLVKVTLTSGFSTLAHISPPEATSVLLDLTLECELLGSQVTLMMLAQGPHFWD